MTEPSTCTMCGAPAPAGRRYCDPICKSAGTHGLTAALTCRHCGKRMYVGKTNAPQGEATCHPCRRQHNVHGASRGYNTLKCRCDECRAYKAAAVRKAERAFYEKNGYWRRKEYAAKSGSREFWISPSTRAAIYERDNWTCQLCGRRLSKDTPPNHRRAPTLDHIICQSWTSTPDHSPENLRLACRSCNAARRDRPDQQERTCPEPSP